MPVISWRPSFHMKPPRSIRNNGKDSKFSKGEVSLMVSIYGDYRERASRIFWVQTIVSELDKILIRQPPLVIKNKSYRDNIIKGKVFQNGYPAEVVIGKTEQLKHLQPVVIFYLHPGSCHHFVFSFPASLQERDFLKALTSSFSSIEFTREVLKGRLEGVKGKVTSTKWISVREQMFGGLGQVRGEWGERRGCLWGEMGERGERGEANGFEFASLKPLSWVSNPLGTGE